MHRRIAELFLFCDEDAIDVPTKNSDNFSFKISFLLNPTTSNIPNCLNL